MARVKLGIFSLAMAQLRKWMAGRVPLPRAVTIDGITPRQRIPIITFGRLKGWSQLDETAWRDAPGLEVVSSAHWLPHEIPNLLKFNISSKLDTSSFVQLQQ